MPIDERSLGRDPSPSIETKLSTIKRELYTIIVMST